MGTIQPKETRYKGYRFRSRLEARWAVFFDAIGVQWDYEKERVKLSSGSYLPDFWIDDWQCWVEIKPDDGTRGNALLPNQLALETNQRVLLITGNPWIGEHRIMPFFYGEGEPDELWHGYYGVFAECRRCQGHCLVPIDEQNGEVVSMGFTTIGKHTCKDHDKEPVVDSCLPAYEAARGARFEHGECG